MEAWQLILSPKLSGLRNMELDLKMFADFENGKIPSTLRIYSWKPKCISYGYAQKVDKLIDKNRAEELGWDLVKRPTGGGIVFHNEAEVTYSLVTALDNPKLPGGLASSYKKLSEAIVYGLGELGMETGIRKQEQGIRKKKAPRLDSGQAEHRTRGAGLCFAYPAEYEIVINNKKIVGSAQKRGRRVLLQQGSIFVRRTDNGDLSVLKNQNDKHNAVSVEEILGREIRFEELSKAITTGFMSVLGVSFNA